jgi:hypothetical protein
VLASLLRAVADCDRLLILGDLIELRHGPERDALAVAVEILAPLGEALGPGREVVIVPGNHDHHLLDGWLEARGRKGPPAPLGLESAVDIGAGALLAAVAAALAPATVRGAYPGIWLRDDVYAMHGHYGDLHLTVPTEERLAGGATARMVRLSGSGPAVAEDYELALAPVYAWIHAVAQRLDAERGGHLHSASVRGWDVLTGGGRRDFRRRLLAAGFPVAVAALNRAGIGPLEAKLSYGSLRRAGLRGTEIAADRLGLHAAHLIFGHTHRAGPLRGDDLVEWVTASGMALINSGCWVLETSFLGADPARSPYRAGFAVIVGDEGPPELVNLLD